MRITGGSLKGFHLPNRFSAHVRPTTDMMREAIFNKLQHTMGVDGQTVLDLFSGSGIFSLECLSRAASHVVSVDRDANNISAMKSIQADKNLGNWEIVKTDVFRFLKKETGTYDIIFADPPYDMKGIQQIPELVLPLLSKDGLLLVEHRPGTHFDIEAKEIRKHGSTAIAIFAATN